MIYSEHLSSTNEELLHKINGQNMREDQGVSQDLEIGCPNLLEISKQGVQIVHLQYIYK